MDGIMHEQTLIFSEVICRSRGGLSANENIKTTLSSMLQTSETLCQRTKINKF